MKCGTGGECIEPPNQHRMCIAQVAPALPGGVSRTTQVKPNDYHYLYCLARRLGQQGGRSRWISRLGPKNFTPGVTLELTRGHDLWLRKAKQSFKQMSPISFAKFLVQTIGEP